MNKRRRNHEKIGKNRSDYGVMRARVYVAFYALGICIICNQDISTKRLIYSNDTQSDALIVSDIGAAKDKDIIIPSVYDGKKVVAIGNACFNGASIISVDIPDSVTSIERGAFSNCSSLKEVNYKGTEEQWNKIEIGKHNSCLTNAKRNYIK